MSIADIFKDCHGAIDKSSLIPIVKMIGKESFPTKKKFKEVIEYLNINPKDVYYDPKSMLNPIIYLSDFIYISLHHFDLNILKMMKFAEGIKTMQKAFKEYEELKDYETIFEMMDKKLLIPNYIKFFDKIPDEQKYEIFVSLHIRSEYGFEMLSESFLKIVFAYQKYSSEYKKRLKELKKKIGKKKEFTIYHGHNKNHDPKDEYSWTLKRETALFFANRFKGSGVISEKQITFDQVIDFYNQRGEEEIILIPEILK